MSIDQFSINSLSDTKRSGDFQRNTIVKRKSLKIFYITIHNTPMILYAVKRMSSNFKLT